MLARVAQPGIRAFQLRKGEEAISIFDLGAVQPDLTESEILNAFRKGSIIVYVTPEEILGRRLEVVHVQGSASLPPRLREAHAEIRPGIGMTRAEFKQALLELEQDEASY